MAYTTRRVGFEPIPNTQLDSVAYKYLVFLECVGMFTYENIAVATISLFRVIDEQKKNVILITEAKRI